MQTASPLHVRSAAAPTADPTRGAARPRDRGQAGQALTEYAVLASVLVASVWVAAGPLGLVAALRRSFGAIHFVLSLPLP
ncbi:MAG TPA: hypothetical protein VGD74_02685 [Vulgatibacter sp.]